MFIVTAGLDNSSAMILFHALKTNFGIHTLKLENCTFTTEGFYQMSECLKFNKTLRNVELEDLDFLGANNDVKIIKFN